MREASRGLCEEVKGEYEDECDSSVKYERRRTSEQPKMNVWVKVKGRVAERASFTSNIIHKLGIECVSYSQVLYYVEVIDVKLTK